MSNARHAVRDSDMKNGRITIRTRPIDAERFVIEVSDTGVGISPENLTKIFTHGFTTKKNGHGFGLHSSSCAALELGGTLTASSAGPGLGAQFLLELPTAFRGSKVAPKGENVTGSLRPKPQERPHSVIATLPQHRFG
jgi:signal transduction histidine kinase